MQRTTLDRRKRVRLGDHVQEPESGITAEMLSDLPNQRTTLCKTCAAIDFNAIIQSRVNKSQGLRIRTVVSADTLATSCPLCRLFGDLVSTGQRTPNSDQQSPEADVSFFEIRAFRSRFFFTGISQGRLSDEDRLYHLAAMSKRQQSDSQIRTLYSYCFLMAPREIPGMIHVRRMSAEIFDFDLARYWWNYCCRNHTKTCTEASNTPIESLRVIDCESKMIIKAPNNCKYVALSYVWGSLAQDEASAPVDQANGETQQLLELPKTIEDSIEVTKKLGLRFLWVDRYCIDQCDKKDKHRQIQQMDRIYSSASLTIIAAAGKSPMHGLPGVNGTLRPGHEILRIDDHCLTRAFDNSYTTGFSYGNSVLLDSCTWTERAWTYQEGILSHRRLIFTDQQVLYQCDAMACSEALRVPLDLMHGKRGDKFVRSSPRGAFPTHRPGKRPWYFMAFVSHYYKRTLSYPEDALNAMRGIFQVFRKAPAPVFSLSGIPIYPANTPMDRFRIPMFREKDLQLGKVEARTCFLLAFTWYHTSAAQRRVEFPSWSWLGWQHGELNHDQGFLGSTAASYFLNSGWDDPLVWIEGFDEQLHDFPGFDALPGFLASVNDYARFIWIEAWTVSCVVAWDQDECQTRVLCYRIQHLSEERSVTGQLFIYFSSARELELFSNSALLEKTYVGIILNNPKPSHSDQKRDIMLVEDKGDYWERVGIIEDYLCRGRNEHLISPVGEHTLSRSTREHILRDWFTTLPKTRRRLRLG